MDELLYLLTQQIFFVAVFPILPTESGFEHNFLSGSND